MRMATKDFLGGNGAVRGKRGRTLNNGFSHAGSLSYRRLEKHRAVPTFPHGTTKTCITADYEQANAMRDGIATGRHLK